MLFCLLVVVHATVQFPDVNCHSGLILRPHAPCDSIPRLSWLGCEPTHCVNGAVRGPDSSGRWACGANSLEIVFDSANACVFEMVCFRCGIPAVVVSFLLIDCLVD